MTHSRMADRFGEQAEACARLGSPMYAALLGRVAADIEAGGVSTRVLAGHEQDPGPSGLALRLAGSVHRLVLAGTAPELAAYYPSVGGRWDLTAAWPVLQALLTDRTDEVRRLLDHPPQTNEVGRAAALMGGLLRLGEQARLPVRLFELGSSAGLNLLADRYAYAAVAEDGRDASGRGTIVHGDPGSPLVLRDAWAGAALQPWHDLAIVERRGSDVRPVDVGDPEGRLTLEAYVWPDQLARLERLRAAIALARRDAVPVLRQDAASFVTDLELREGSHTVLWHSVVWQYLPRDQQERVTAAAAHLGEAATESARFAHLVLEPTRRTPGTPHEFLVVLRAWPGGERRILGRSVGHGLPTTWE